MIGYKNCCDESTIKLKQFTEQKIIPAINNTEVTVDDVKKSTVIICLRHYWIRNCLLIIWKSVKKQWIGLRWIDVKFIFTSYS